MTRGRAVLEDPAESVEICTENKKQFKKYLKVVKDIQNKGTVKKPKQHRTSGSILKAFFKWG